MPTSLHSIQFPGETSEYRTARNQLLEAEAELRRRLEAVAALRRQLPLGGAIKEDYTFIEGGDGETTRPVRFSELFARGKDTLVVYSFMFGPQMAAACPSCTSILDSLDRIAPHATQRVNLAVVAKSPLPRIRQFAQERGWTNLRLLSSAENTYNVDYHAEDEKGNQLPVLNVFARRGGNTHHFYATELLYAPREPGMDGRHVDLIWPLWNLFDLMPEGRGTDWYPRLSY